MNQETITSGHPLIQKYCSECHMPPRPSKYTANEWPAVVKRMLEHRQRLGLEPLKNHDIESIIRYLKKVS